MKGIDASYHYEGYTAFKTEDLENYEKITDVCIKEEQKYE